MAETKNEGTMREETRASPKPPVLLRCPRCGGRFAATLYVEHLIEGCRPAPAALAVEGVA